MIFPVLIMYGFVLLLALLELLLNHQMYLPDRIHECAFLLVFLLLTSIVHKQYQMEKELDNQNKSQRDTCWWKNEVLYCKSVEC